MPHCRAAGSVISALDARKPRSARQRARPLRGRHSVGLHGSLRSRLRRSRLCSTLFHDRAIQKSPPEIICTRPLSRRGPSTKASTRGAGENPPRRRRAERIPKKTHCTGPSIPPAPIREPMRQSISTQGHTSRQGSPYPGKAEAERKQQNVAEGQTEDQPPVKFALLQRKTRPGHNAAYGQRAEQGGHDRVGGQPQQKKGSEGGHRCRVVRCLGTGQSRPRSLAETLRGTGKLLFQRM